MLRNCNNLIRVTLGSFLNNLLFNQSEGRNELLHLQGTNEPGACFWACSVLWETGYPLHDSCASLAIVRKSSALRCR